MIHDDLKFMSAEQKEELLDEFLCNKPTPSNTQDKFFDSVIGFIEDIVVHPDFQHKQTNFLDKYCHEFEHCEENKLIYTPIFNEYVSMIEKHIESELVLRLPKFDMSEFMKILPARRNEVSEELFEMLLSLTDFLIFKELILDHKSYRDGKVADLSFGLTVTSFRKH
ncbi:ADP-ribosylation factor-like protein 2-binding protein [Hydra vulgaris]|uniref:ADP-ribosylation factor-like protein 2-binding protein n=1 Tax=Hydra vulgaris TaxID=6087 RepID=UPI001F5E7F22|nr:ADP-ribosylation factor-like protein 2-binding protein isoform X1 [Hydra vulgaris]